MHTRTLTRPMIRAVTWMLRRTAARLRPHGAGGWLGAALAVGILANGLRLRRRLSALTIVPPRKVRVAPDPDHVFLTAPGVHLDEALRGDVSDYAMHENLAVLDLVPGNLGSEQALDLARLVDPATARANRLAPGRGAGQAMLVHRDVLDRAGIFATHDLDPVAFLRATAAAKRYAATSTDLAVVPGLRAGPVDIAQRRAYLEALYAQAMPLFAGAPIAEHIALAAAVALNPAWGLAALTAYAVQPALATSGSYLHPHDRTFGATLTRPVVQAVRSVRALFGGWSPPSLPASTDPRAPAQIEATRAEYRALLADGTERFFEPRRATCPLCEGDHLSELLRAGDLLQHKPGEFVLDECHDCGHVFQNPRLSLDGLDFYYRDFYDGMGADELEFVFSWSDRSYQGRAHMLTDVATPKRWLDVGGGHGHFCLVAAEVWPETRFDGLDLSDAIADAERRGWIERGYQGLFPDLAADLTGSYDVVSMHHYLEHTRDPRAEIAAAHTVLEPGGHLLIEVPDPESRFGRRAGRYWGPWFQPQHQHFMSIGNLRRELEAQGFSMVRTERGPAHQPVDLAFTMWMYMNDKAPAPAKPWLDPPTRGARVRRAATFTALGPFLIAALIADHVLLPITSRVPGGPNTYRVLARKHD